MTPQNADSFPVSACGRWRFTLQVLPARLTYLYYRISPMFLITFTQQTCNLY